jgi:polyhydroxyalkanoate synthesis regulator phasin
MKRLIASVAAAGILVAGAFVASTATDSPAEAQTIDDTTTQESQERPEKGAILDEVLGELVDAGTINQSQATAVKEALQAKHEELKANRPDGEGRRHRRGHLRAQTEELLDDGVISAEEIAELPDGHPFKNDDGPFAELIEDGQITQAEWDDFVAEKKAEREAQQSDQDGDDA